MYVVLFAQLETAKSISIIKSHKKIQKNANTILMKITY